MKPQAMTDKIRAFFRHQPVSRQLSAGNRDKIDKAVFFVIHNGKAPAFRAAAVFGMASDQGSYACIRTDIAGGFQNRNQLRCLVNNPVDFRNGRMGVIRRIDLNRCRPQKGYGSPGHQDIPVPGRPQAG